MLETPHVAVGAVIALKVGNPYLSLPLALASHFVLDKVPHWNPHTYTETTNGGLKKQTIAFALTDITLSAIIGLSLSYSQLPNVQMAVFVLLGGLLGVLPDVVKYPFFLIKKTQKGLYKKYVDFERSLQVEVGFYTGMLVQIGITLIALWWFYN